MSSSRTARRALVRSQLRFTPDLYADLFEKYRPGLVIAASPGFRRLWLSRCLERNEGYLLLVEWDRLADHTEGFRGSAAYAEWKALLHGFYDPFPVVEHFETVLTAEPPD